ncbi:MAG: DNA-deoxyinosine glycosylase [Gammaproteobacteria bacterium]|nr:DNA-deoxyinosine glycosylase [Gammaproteobacteria bacterium]NNJ92856.1 DNA-deoxyinosine glycosylase [Gammaproteobacteria bacterium]
MSGLLESFPPIASANSHTLILGSMPGIKSLQANQYYAHPRNLFWPFISELLKFDLSLSYEERIIKLKENDIALWDVLQHCHRQGSLDSDIRKDSMVPNDFAGFLKQHRSIRHIFFNGKKSEEVFRRNVMKTIQADFPDIRYTGLPSTSPANASIKREEKFRQWKQVLSS